MRYANRAAETMLGYPPGGIIDRPLIDFEPGFAHGSLAELMEARTGQRGRTAKFRNPVRAGRWQHFADGCFVELYALP
ncbi:PAS domain-containing protein [Pseudomonas sp. B21-040]|uniref:PAS domain-containing protein n=1 Tax=Pseudomonas sp. B21-040 TaxID=2895486 RepID=UPI0038D3F910